MRKASLFALSTAAIFTISGCSGHALQDLADATFNNKETEPKEEITETTTVEKSVEIQPVVESAAITKTSDATVAPSQNNELNRVSPMPVATSEGGAMQKSLDEWTEKEWTPTVEKDEKIKSMNEDEGRPFTLQEYIDKAEVYMANKPKSDTPSHAEALEQLPVIGN